jgi:hypothetical protein
MSHYNLVRTKLTDPVALQDALEVFFPGCVQVAPNVFDPTLPTRNYYGQAADPVSFKVGKEEARNAGKRLYADLGFSYGSDGTFTLQMDDMDQFNMEAFTVEYNVCSVERAYPGYDIAKEVQGNGDVILTLVERS